MPLIESLRIHTVQLAHAYRKVPIECINEQMVMILHQTVCVAEPIVSKGYILKGIQKHLSVQIISENCLSFVSSARDVIDSTWKLYT